MPEPDCHEAIRSRVRKDMLDEAGLLYRKYHKKIHSKKTFL